MKRRLLILIGCISAVYVQAQTITDSLQKALLTAEDNEDKLLLLIKTGQEYENSDLEKSKSYYWEARSLGKKINYPLTEVKFISNYTFALNMQGKYDSSLYWNLQGIEEAKKLNDDEQLAKAYFNTGTSYQYLAYYPSAVEHYQKGLAFFEKLGNEQFMAQANDILQTLYTSMKQYDKAIMHGKYAIAASRHLDQPKLLAYSLLNLGVAYQYQHKSDTAYIYFKEAEQIAKQINDEVTLTSIEINLGNMALWQKQLNVSKSYNELALARAKKNGLKESECIATRGISNYYLYSGEYENALKYAESALAIAEQYGLRSEKVILLNHLYTLAHLNKNPWQARAYSNEAGKLEDELLSDEILKHTIQIEKKFELDKKNTQLRLQEETIQHKNLLNWLLIGGLISLLIMVVLGYRNYSNRKKIQEQRIKEFETEKQLLATQSLLKGQEDERSRIAKDLHDGLGGLLSGVKLQLGAMKGNLFLTEENGMAFNRVLNNLEESISEMRRVAHNMMPETLLKFGLEQALTDYSNGLSHQQKFTIQCAFLGMEKRLHNSIEVIIYRVVQELITNAVKHSEASSILVQLMRPDEAHLNITVEDNGKGFDLQEVKENSAGLRNIASRVKYLNGKMDIQSAPGTGTSVYIECEIKPHG